MTRILLGCKQQDRKLFSMSKIYFDSVDSTNVKATEFNPGDVIVAKVQTKGKGRFERVWESSEGGLWFSIVLKPTRKLCEYTFIASLAVFDALDFKADIKWPNDLYYEGKKLCGILSEIVSVGSTVSKIAVGMGLNVNNAVPPEGISVKEIVGSEVDASELLDKILDNFERLSDLGIKTIIERYRKNCSMLGKRVCAKTLQGDFKGKALDIDDEGNLLVETKEGVVRLSEGDATIL
jgi:BirA family transcriptional regulator, biotin operon repressor / biotin---[acetyl-CoA-carboxylase] ligase